MLKANRLKKDFFYKDRLIFRLDDPVANMTIRHVYYALGTREKTYGGKNIRVSFCLVSSSALVHLANFKLSYHKFYIDFHFNMADRRLRRHLSQDEMNWDASFWVIPKTCC